ncbi:MarR family winged helix-turn-helix transcriptional regulator [Paracoccus sp. PAR01]|jgi:DNA-binding MarR family transcriptional regulator|uniref:MarR family winged helix-turn-helix transcriptional regulator n=1 Tax=Paracoccus TaxID=265 RepID=UPI001782103B|nr:MarR family transcriptional regulator [Paracoccus sp. PAR01]MBD9529932.1 MarR family transcriptional regulator [Paracoccus sp. PAR01]
MTETAGTPDHVAPQVTDMLCFSIYSAGHAFTQLYRPLLGKIGLTYPQYLVMLTLWRRDGQNVKELGNTLFLDSSTLTPLLKRLDAAGLITRKRNPKDEREVLLTLTEEGRALQSEAADVMKCVEDALALNGETIDAIRASVDDIRDRLQGNRE